MKINNNGLLICLIYTSCTLCLAKLSQRNVLTNFDKIQTIRENVLKHYDKTNFTDVESIRNSKWFIERYLHQYNNDEKKAEKAIIESFEYFHKEGLHCINDSFFPSEAFALGSFYRFGTSKFGQPLIGVLMNHIKPFGPKLSKTSITKLSEKFCLYIIYKTLFEAKEKNFIIYINFKNKTMDFNDYNKFKMKKDMYQATMVAINRYFPGVPLKLYTIGMNKIMEMAVKFLVQFLETSLKERLTFVDGLEDIQELISLEEIPFHAGGLSRSYTRIPPGVKSGKCLPHLSYISQKEWDIYRAINSGAIDEGMKEENIDSMDQYLRSCD